MEAEDPREASLRLAAELGGIWVPYRSGVTGARQGCLTVEHEPFLNADNEWSATITDPESDQPYWGARGPTAPDAIRNVVAKAQKDVLFRLNLLGEAFTGGLPSSEFE